MNSAQENKNLTAYKFMMDNFKIEIFSKKISHGFFPLIIKLSTFETNKIKITLLKTNDSFAWQNILIHII